MPHRIGLPIDTWPAGDRAAWQRATSTVDFFADDGVAAGWRPKSQQQACYAYARWLANLSAHSSDALVAPPAQRVTPERLEAYVAWLATRIKPMSVAAELQHLLLALRALAPREDWTWLGKIQYRFARHAHPRDQRHKMVDPRRLLKLGCTLMDSANDDSVSPLARARQFRDGLLIALLVMIPLRRRSLTALHFGQHVRQVGDAFHLNLAGDDTKAGHAVDFVLPHDLAPYFSRYLTQHRPRFPRPSLTTALWLSSKGGALGADAIYNLVCRRTHAWFGFAIHPHLFRTIAATTIAREAPDRISVARDLLTHAQLDTTLRHYAQAQTVQAARDHGALIARLRAQDPTARQRDPSGYVPADPAGRAPRYSRGKP